jgi:hypothetical protein
MLLSVTLERAKEITNNINIKIFFINFVLLI